MKFIYCCSILFLLTTQNLYAYSSGNPGSNYLCLTYTESKLYTHYSHDAYAPGNPWWGPFHYYDDASGVYGQDYDTATPGCGQVNPSNLTDAGEDCFVNVGGTAAHGRLKTFTSGQVVPCPVDDRIWSLLIGAGALGSYFVAKRKLII